MAMVVKTLLLRQSIAGLSDDLRKVIGHFRLSKRVFLGNCSYENAFDLPGNKREDEIHCHVNSFRSKTRLTKTEARGID